jgi:hypothetical protein
MTKPEINQSSDSKGKQETYTANPADVLTDPADVLTVARVAVTEGPAAAAACGVNKSEEIFHQLALGVHEIGEMSLPTVRRYSNKIFNTSLGTVVDRGGWALGVGAGVWVLVGIFKARSARKLAEANVIEEEFAG